MLVMRSTSPNSAPRAQDLVTSRRLIAWLTWKEEPHFWPAMAELHRQPQQQSREDSNVCKGVHQLDCMARHSRGLQQRVQACGGDRLHSFAVTKGHWQQSTSQIVGPCQHL